MPETTYHMYKCRTGCGHTTVVDKYYKTRRVFCGVCGEKSCMEYQGEARVEKQPTFNIFGKK